MTSKDPEEMADAPPSEPQDDDPITASYKVFLNPALPLGRRLLVLQHPNRTDEAPRPPPSELRLKANAGMVEVDMPLDTGAAYDREKGLNWGKTLKQSMTMKNGGSHGLAGGFGVGAVQQRGGGAGGKGKGAARDEDDDLTWGDAVRQDKVLRTQTLGGQYPDSKEVQYMVGVFQGQNLHLTPVSSLVHLRPQLHHIDATTHLERQAASKESSGAGASGGSGAGASNPARAIHMTVKSTTEGDGLGTETMADRLKIVQGEPWRKMRYTDENEEAAWDVYSESMFLRRPGESNSAAGNEEAAAPEKSLEESVPRFESRWEDKKLLETISGIIKDEGENDDDFKAEEEAQMKAIAEAEERKKAASAATRTRGGGAAGAARGRGGRAKATTARSATVNVN
ncbi:sin-like protein conserved region domain-containing protein [Sarocladium implicatum]|nr:sin-like protein conserved region domain-containing protein [Sarocladium implicatum]